MNNLSVIATIAYRDVLKFIRDRTRIIATFIFPIIFIGILGSSFQSNLGNLTGFNFLTFIFTGILAQTLFQSSSAGIISLIEDRENDFSQEMFVSPISRYSIIIGKITGESIVAFIQAIGVVIFGLLIRVPISIHQLLILVPVGLVSCLLGGAFGVLVMSQLKSQRAANQIFPFLIFPQYFLSGAFTPIKNLPWYLFILSRISPMTYAVDLTRSVYYLGEPDYKRLVLYNPLFDLVIIAILFIIMLFVGTYYFVKNERNR